MLMIKFKASDMAPCLLALNYSPRLDHDFFLSDRTSDSQGWPETHSVI